MRRIQFYRTEAGTCPVEEFLDYLNPKQSKKVLWVMQMVRQMPKPPVQYFKKLIGTDLWEIRTQLGSDAFRLIGFFDGEQLIILTSGFAKKTQRTPKQEIETAKQRMKDYFNKKE
ncbi:MAG: type II toxin-antitoxin system RelE/ParE family toxin [Puniceicoccaceae bacterium]